MDHLTTSFGQRSWTQKRSTERLVSKMIAYIVPMELLWQPTAESAMTRFSTTGEFSKRKIFKKHWKVFAENVRFHQSPIQYLPHHTLTMNYQKSSLMNHVRSKITGRIFSSKIRKFSSKPSKLKMKSLTLSSLQRRKKQSEKTKNVKNFVQITLQSGRQLFPERKIDWFIAPDSAFYKLFQ